MTKWCDLETRVGSKLLWCTNPGCNQPGYAPPINTETGEPYPPELIHRVCGIVIKQPPLYRRAWSFAKAWARYWWNGRPATSEHLREQRLAICKACDNYKDGGCLKCGCPVADKRKFLADKLSMATERCPLNPPKWGRVELAPSLGIRSWLAYLSPWESVG